MRCNHQVFKSFFKGRTLKKIIIKMLSDSWMVNSGLRILGFLFNSFLMRDTRWQNPSA